MVNKFHQVVCFIALTTIVITSSNIANANGNIHKQIVKKEQNEKQEVKKQIKQIKQTKKQQAKIAKQNSNNVDKKKVVISKDVKKKLKSRKQKKAVKAITKLSFVAENDELKNDKAINDLIDKQSAFVFLKRIPVNTNNKGVPNVCLPVKTQTKQEVKQINNAIKERKSDLKNHIKQMLKANNINDDLINRIVKNLHHIKKTIVKNQEFIKRSDEEFLTRYDIPARIKGGLLYKDVYKKELNVLEDVFYVNQEALLTIWSMETAFGNNIGNYDAFNALYSACMNATTMARINYFEKNLIFLAKLVQDGYFKENVISSFDGGLGGCQFMPDSFYKYGVAYNGGKADIIGNNLDVLASIANYLHNIGWRYNEGVLTEIILPDNFDVCNIGMNTRKTIAEWKALGIKQCNNNIGEFNLLNEDRMASVIVLDIDDENKKLQDKRAFLVYDNFKVILGYNQAPKYGITAGLIYEDLIAKAMNN